MKRDNSRKTLVLNVHYPFNRELCNSISSFASSDLRCHSKPGGSVGIIGFLMHLFLNVLCLSECSLLNYRTGFQEDGMSCMYLVFQEQTKISLLQLSFNVFMGFLSLILVNCCL